MEVDKVKCIKSETQSDHASDRNYIPDLNDYPIEEKDTSSTSEEAKSVDSGDKFESPKFRAWRAK